MLDEATKRITIVCFVFCVELLQKINVKPRKLLGAKKKGSEETEWLGGDGGWKQREKCAKQKK